MLRRLFNTEVLSLVLNLGNKTIIPVVEFNPTNPDGFSEAL